MEIQVYKSQVGKPVKKPSPVSDASIAPGLQALGQGLSEGALAVGNVVQEVQRRQEYDFAVNEATKEVDAFFEDMRLNPILPKVGDLQDEAGGARPEAPLDIVKLREESWEEKRREIEEKYFSSINHARARDDVGAWWSQSSEKIRSDLANESISESLQYHGKLREQMIEEHIQRGELEDAFADIAYGTDNGFWSRAAAVDLYQYARDEHAFQGGLKTVLDGYTDEEGNQVAGFSSYERPIEGLEAGYDIIEDLSVDDAIKDRIKNELQTQYSEENRIYTEKREMARDESWDEFTVAIESGHVTPGNVRQWKEAIAEDPRLDDFPGTKEHLWDRMNRAVDPGSGGSEAERMFDQAAFDIWANRRLTDELAYQQMRERNRLGLLPDEKLMYWARQPRKLVSEVVTDAVDDIRSVGDDLCDGLEGEAYAAARSRADEALFKFQQVVADIGEEGSDEDVLLAKRNVLKNLYADSLELTGWSPSSDFAKEARFDSWRLTDTEKMRLAFQNGDARFIEGVSNMAQARAFFEVDDRRRLLEEYGHFIKSAVPLEGPGVSFECETPEGPRTYRYFVDGKKTLLQRWDAGSGDWVESTLQRTSEVERQETAEAVGAEWDRPHPMPGGSTDETSGTVEPSPVETREYSGIPEDLVPLRLDVARRRAERRDLLTPSFDEDIKEAKKLMVIERLQGRYERGRDIDVDLVIRWLEASHYPSGQLHGIALDIMRRAGVQ